MVLGGTRRTLLCPCGWTAKGIPSRLDLIQRLHKNVCPLKIDSTPSSKLAFNTQLNGLNGVKTSNRGHVVQTSIKAIVTMGDGMVGFINKA